MTCFRLPLRRREQETIGLVCTVSDAASHSLGGEIRLQISDAVPPVQVDWFQNGSAALLQLSPDRRRATNVPPGMYNIVVTDATDTEASCTVTVQLIDIPAVTGYDIVHATGDTARDGAIRVLTRGTNGRRFLWSNGVVSSTEELNDVAPGTYVAIPLEDDVFLHDCQAAVVKPSRHACM